MKETPKELERKIENKQIQAEMLIELARNDVYDSVLNSTTDTLLKIVNNGFIEKESDINSQLGNKKDEKIKDLNNNNNIKVFLYSFVRLLDSTNVINMKEPPKEGQTADEMAQDMFNAYFKTKKK